MPAAASASSTRRRARAEKLAERLYATHRSRLLAIARRNSAADEDAEEALQDAFIAFIEHFDPDGGAPPLAWLTLTLKRRCWALYRLRRRSGDQHPHGELERCVGVEVFLGRSARPDRLVELVEEVVDVRGRLAELKRDERRALSLLAVGFSYREICELTGWTYTKVNRCISEGRVALRQDL